MLLSSRDRQKLGLLILSIIGSSFMGVAGVASIMPFVSVLAAPESVTRNPFLSWFYKYFDFQDLHSFILYLGIALLLFFVLSNCFLAFSLWFNLHFVRTVSFNLTKRLFTKYLYQPYEFYLNRNSAELSKNLFSEIYQVFSYVIRPVMEVASQGFMAASIVVFLIVTDPIMALTSAVVLGSAYALFFVLVRSKLLGIGMERVKLNSARFGVANEAFGGIKDIKLMGKEEEFIARFAPPVREFEALQALSQLLAKLPRYALEVIAFGGILAISIYLFAVKNTIADVLPIIALYAFAGYRLMPSLQDVFRAVAEIRSSMASLDVLYKDLLDEKEVVQINKKRAREQDRAPIELKDTLELKNIVFRYESRSEPVLENFNLTIKANTTIGFVGPTGCGKTTAVDIILGLLHPQEGRLVVDGVRVTDDNLRLWQKRLGYVPQQIFLADDTITRNIAFGIPDELIDMDSVVRAAGTANLHRFIEKELPMGYNTVVGERGIRLSGGQRQRIGIARALYSDPGIIILDEATSALDSLTESAVMGAIDNLGHTKTIIIIAHRISTVKKCDTIYLMESGKIVASGTYDELVESSEAFRAVANQA